MLMLFVLAAATGCETGALIVAAVQGPETVAPHFQLPDVATLVLVDDPDNLLNNSNLSRQIGATAVHYMKFHKALETAEFIEPKAVARLESRLSKAWSATPIDQIARKLNAKQIIYAKVTDVQTDLTETLYRPRVSLEVKVITADAERLWPAPPALVDPQKTTPGSPLNIRLNFASRASRKIGDATPDDLSRRLADEAGLALGRLFYEWEVPEPGSDL